VAFKHEPWLRRLLPASSPRIEGWLPEGCSPTRTGLSDRRFDPWRTAQPSLSLPKIVRHGASLKVAINRIEAPMAAAWDRWVQSWFAANTQAESWVSKVRRSTAR